MDNLQSESLESFLRKIGVGRRSLNDPFFEDSHKACKVFRRTGVTVTDDEELCHEVMREFPCNVFNCNERFRNLIEYEIHYNGAHRYVCQECKKIKPNARLLEIHIQENHDSFFQVAADKKSMYQCFVSECKCKFSSPKERKDHCTIVHKFPKIFRYYEDTKAKNKLQLASTAIVKDSMEVEESKPPPQTKKTKVRLNKNQKCRTFIATQSQAVPVPSNEQDSVMECSEQPEISKKCEGAVESSVNTSCNSALAFIPRQVQKSYTNALTKNKNMERNVLETETLMDLADSLP